jgi:predicted MPP superfamily phosphohydrolase
MVPPPAAGRLTRREVLKGLVGVSVGAAAGTAAHGFLYERYHVDVTRTSVRVAALPPALSGLRIGFLSDVHRSATVGHALVATAIDRLLSERPDLILLGGDYVTWGGRDGQRRSRYYVDPAAEALAKLSAPFGVYGIIGNHDDERDLPAALASRGVEILKDERTRLTIRGETLDLIGIRYWTTRYRDIAAVARGRAEMAIFLAHNPKRITEAAELSLPLMLSGHTHGGQIVLPGLGAVAARSFPIVAGTGRRGPTTAFVSRGIGTVYVPVRVNCPPEVAVLSLEAARES